MATGLVTAVVVLNKMSAMATVVGGTGPAPSAVLFKTVLSNIGAVM